MYREFYNLVEFLVQRFQEHPLTHTVVFGTIDVRDISKQNIFPLVHIRPTGIDVGNQIVTADFEIAVVSQRNTPDEKNTSKIDNDNLIDNLNETFAILNSIIFDIKGENNMDLINIESDNKANPIIWEEKNTLDGWYINISISIPTDNC